MASHSNVRYHRAAAAAAQRRAPNPQLGFQPTAQFTDPANAGPTGIFGGLPDIFPPRPGPQNSISDDLPLTPSATSSSSSSSASSTSSSSSSSATSSSSSTTLSSSSTISSTSTTPTATRLSLTTAPVSTAVVTVSIPRSSSATLSAPSASNSADNADTSSGMSTGAVVGGIGAGVVAIAVIGFAVAYFIRRSRKRDSEGAFDTQNFRRSAVLLDDPPTHEDTVARGYNNPPPMVERYASPAPTFGTQYGHPGPAVYGGDEHYDQYGAGGYAAGNGAGYGSAATYQSFQPGQIMNVDGGIPPAPANPMYATPAYTQNPFSPAISVPDEYRDQSNYNYHSNGHQNYEYSQHQSDPSFPAPVSIPQPVLTRQPSASAPQYPNPNTGEIASNDPHRPSPLQLKRESAPANDYVDLNRSSVSPYQAAQYVEISRRLNADVPAGLATADVERELPMPPPPVAGSGNNSPGPFADPGTPHTPGGAQYAIDRRYSGDADIDARAEPQARDFPAPPSPVHTPGSASRYRIDSMPPTLPEIHVESRVSVSSVGVDGAALHSQGLAQGGLTTGTRSQFPTTPSPLASSFGFPSPAPNATEFTDPKHPAIPPAAASPSTATPPSAQPAAPKHKKQASMQSVYDADDAYGGF
ncbi:hypothetical protein JR316_0007077 [Psilocybe cubensis]|uniref:Uncharacterized protein n=2 Tax=Psilocybe cubensis TaxID=181762 RepID=A0A8H8CN21_PSICU|nr:hypothetical protein JR316_0007077 [Psilocybe cubensis]KAH9480477.1 hypothetical protein JR316_0007077 [Psilocybe cubensis]